MDIENIIEDAKEAGFHTTGDWKVQIQPSQYDGISNENIFVAITKFAEIRNKRAVASAEVLVEALREILKCGEDRNESEMDWMEIANSRSKYISKKNMIASKALATYDKISEVKHDTK